MDPSSESLRSGPDPSPGPGLGRPIAAAAAAAAARPAATRTETDAGESPAATMTASSPGDRSTTEHAPGTAAAAAVVEAEGAVTASNLARFEFSELGTKVLMVEWYPGAVALPTPADDADPAALAQRSPNDNAQVPAASSPSLSRRVSDSAGTSTAGESAEWNVSWPGKSTHLPARETDEDGTRRRVYFMLPSDVPVPGTITVSRPGNQTIVLKPLPAIFPEHLEVASGPRGVLHTRWAKKRLMELDGEIESELRTNAESVGLEMALAEKQWIVDNFLPAPAPSPQAASGQMPLQAAPRSTRMAPRPPTHPSGRLGDKLKALRLATGSSASAAGLAPSSKANTFTVPGSISSPPGSDVAASSFSAISRAVSVTTTVSAAAGVPSADPMSLNSILLDGPSSHHAGAREEDDLFALPMSPRSPDMIKSPFSILGAQPF